MRDRLVELLQKHGGLCPYCADGIEYIADHLLSEGVIVPPVKVGDTIYLARFGNVEEHAVEKMEIGTDNKIYLFFHWHGGGYEFISADEAFASREEAEKALKEKDNGT